MLKVPDYPRKILHADDDPIIHDVIDRALKGLDGVEVKSVYNGKELVDSTESFEPDLILIDLKMPDMDGPLAIAELRSLRGPSEVPVIFFTGFQDIVMKDEYRNLGVIGVIHKPISPGILPERIRFLWCQHHDLPTNIEASGFM